MAENGAALQPTAFKSRVPRFMRPRLAQLEIVKAGYLTLDANVLQSRAKVGKYIEQQGAADITRSKLAHTYSLMEANKARIELKITEAEVENDKEAYLKWVEVLTHCLEAMARAATAMNHTSKHSNSNDEPANNTPTMPARTVINNNTQVNIVPPKPPDTNGNPA